MRPLSFEHAEACEQLVEQVAGFVAATGSLSELELLAPSRCHGWSALDLLVHVRMGLEEMVTGVHPADGDPTHDAASYWADHPDDRDDDPVPHILWLRRVASAYARPAAAVKHLDDVARSVTAGVRTFAAGTVAFQGKLLTSGDFLATWVVELAVHQLDLGIADDEPSGLGWTRRTLEAIAGAGLPADLEDRAAVLLGLGRSPGADRLRLPPGYPVSL